MTVTDELILLGQECAVSLTGDPYDAQWAATGYTRQEMAEMSFQVIRECLRLGRECAKEVNHLRMKGGKE